MAIFTLTFPEGAIVTAQIDAESADAEYSVVYSGAVDRLPEKFNTADVRVLRVGEERREAPHFVLYRALTHGLPRNR